MVLQYRGKSVVSRWIEWFTWGRYSHTSWSFCTVVNGVLRGDLSEYESWTTGGVQCVGMIGQNHTVHTRIDLYELRKSLNRDEIENGMLFLNAQLGKKYDYLGIVGFLFRAKTDSTDRWFCSELIFTFLRRCGRTILQGIEAYKITPQMIPLSTEVIYIGYIYAGEGLRVYQEGGTSINPMGTSGILKMA